MTCFSSCFRRKPSPPRRTSEIEDALSSIQKTKLYTYKELQIATSTFSPANKIGEGGFGSVYKGILRDGTIVAIKVLAEDSSQGIREFMTEINVIADTVHDNLVKLYGCCLEGKHRILVYGYLENNSLAQTLLGGEQCGIQFSWPTRRKICIGVAEGLAFLHEEVQPHIVHRDIKASNILLDRDLTPKISDFGLAKLFPANKTHISTRVAGTAGYLAPEYAIRGQLNRKADVYSFGVLLLEVVCGRSNISKRFFPEEQYLLERVWEVHEEGKLVTLVDKSLNGDVDYDAEEACRYLKVGLLCTQYMPKLRPSMSVVVKMLKGDVHVNDMSISRPGLLPELRHFKGKIGKSELKTSSYSDSPSSSKLPDSYPSTSGESHGTMTFNSIYDRST